SACLCVIALVACDGGSGPVDASARDAAEGGTVDGGFPDVAPDPCALDADGDRIPDGLEGDTDVDGDGLGNGHDLDSDGDSILDSVEAMVVSPTSCATYEIDTDFDGSPNARDVDSDGDGYPDAAEAGDASLDTPPVECANEVNPVTRTRFYPSA